MIKLSLCMIVKDEESVLPRCLDSVKDCVDEIVIVDTGSTDQTVCLARKYTDLIFPFEWKNDFSLARNYSLSKGTGDYLMWLDADDVIEETDKEKLLSLKKLLTSTPYDIVNAQYKTVFNADTPPLSYERERIFKRDKNFTFQGFVHECVAPNGRIFHSDFCVTHRPIEKQARTGRNLDLYRFHIQNGRTLSPRDLFYYARELYYNGYLLESEGVFQAFLKNEQSWYVNKIEATKFIALCKAQKEDFSGALSVLFSSFLYGEPRAYILCEIAHIFIRKREYQNALFWYLSAMRCSSKQQEGDFENGADFTLTPMLGISYCHFHLGNFSAARRTHEELKRLYPTHPSVLYNEKFFSSHT